MSKSTKATVAQRVDEVFRLLVVGARAPDILQCASTRGWRVGDRQIRRYVASARDQMVELANSKRGNLLGLQMAQRQALYARAFKEGDIAMCLDILKDDAKLLGLYQKPNAVPVILSEQSPAQDLELRNLPPRTQLSPYRTLWGLSP